MFPVIPFGRPVVVVGSSSNRERGRLEGYAAAMRDMERERALRDLEGKKQNGDSKSKKIASDSKGAFTKYLSYKDKHEQYRSYLSREADDDWNGKTRYPHPSKNPGRNAYTKYREYQEYKAPSGNVDWDYSQRKPERGPSKHTNRDADAYARYQQYKDQDHYDSRRQEMSQRPRGQAEMAFWDGNIFES